MSVSYNGPVRVYKRNNPTNNGVANTNAAGLTIGDNTGAAVISQEVWVFQSTAVAGNLPFYEIGVGGNSFIGGNISIPAPNDVTTQSLVTIPAGSRIQQIQVNILQAPTAITGGSISFNINGTAIGSVTVGTTLGGSTLTWVTALAGLRLAGYVGASDAVFTATLAGTGITGGILADISVSYTVKNADGSIRAYGSGLTNDGTNAPNF